MVLIAYLFAGNAPGRRSFRPLTGIMVLISSDLSGDIYEMLEMFPSPYGDYGSYRLYDDDTTTAYEVRFRPLTGIMVLIRQIEIVLASTKSKFPSPYGDYGSYPHPL